VLTLVTKTGIWMDRAARPSTHPADASGTAAPAGSAWAPLLAVVARQSSHLIGIDAGYVQRVGQSVIGLEAVIAAYGHARSKKA